ncbi:MAG: phosphopantothenoylcysteine decarboxylase [Eubacteriales bacterium]|nr:phosphopantothenoylcysteine decarboxylase [Eubacteriales bacterium]
MVRNIIITAGGTSEKIDEVRVISNFSSGRLGLAVAKCFLESETADVGKIYYLCDRNTIVPSDERVEIVRVLGVQGLLDALTNLLTTKKIDAMIHAMAVSDYAVKKVTTIEAIKNGVDMSDKITADGKISSEIDDLVIVLKRTPKVIGEIKKLQKDTILVGFKLLSNVSKDELIETGYKLLKKNDCDMVLANDLSEISGDNHVGYLISQNGEYEKFTTKIQIAEEIVRNTERLLHKKEENK